MEDIKQINEQANIRKLATISKISNIEPIEWANNIELIYTRGWKCVAKKGEFSVGDLAIYIEIDSVLPDGLSEDLQLKYKEISKLLSKSSSQEEKDNYKKQLEELSKQNTIPCFEFLRNSKFRIKSRMIFETISQGICLPLSILHNFKNLNNEILTLKDNTIEVKLNYWINKVIPIEENLDITDLLNITQYTIPESASLGGDVKGELSQVGVLMSDEIRYENLDEYYDKLKSLKYYITSKLEGASVTYYIKNNVFGCCSRSLDLKETENNTIWKVARKLDIENKMKSISSKYNLSNFALGGEIVGEGIQGNIYKLKSQTVCFYNAFDIDNQLYLDYDIFINLIKDLELETVPIIYKNFELSDNIEELKNKVDNYYETFGNNRNQLCE